MSTPDSPSCISCSKPRKLRRGSAVSREGANGKCSSCSSRDSKTAGDPYVGLRWYEREAPPARQAVPLKSGFSGYGRAA